MTNPSPEPPASSKAPDQDLKDMDALCTYKINIKRQKLEHECIRDQLTYPNKNQNAQPSSGTSRILKSTKLGIKGHGCKTFIITTESQNQDHGLFKGQLQYQNEHQDGKLWSITSSIPKVPKLGSKGHGCSFHLQFKIEN